MSVDSWLDRGCLWEFVVWLAWFEKSIVKVANGAGLLCYVQALRPRVLASDLDYFVLGVGFVLRCSLIWACVVSCCFFLWVLLLRRSPVNYLWLVGLRSLLPNYSWDCGRLVGAKLLVLCKTLLLLKVLEVVLEGLVDMLLGDALTCLVVLGV